MNRRMSAQQYRQFAAVGGKKPRAHEEDDLTKEVAKYLHTLLEEGKIAEFAHIPQETYTKSWMIKRKNKAMGVRPGVPDMIVVYPGTVLFLELKRAKGGVLSPTQAKWLDALSGAGKDGGRIVAKLARGWDEAKAAIDELL